jgi:hypothetical protein
MRAILARPRLLKNLNLVGNYDNVVAEVMLVLKSRRAVVLRERADMKCIDVRVSIVQLLLAVLACGRE